MEDTIKQISDALGRIFRHILPGACIVIAAWLSHPCWFPSVDYSDYRYLLILAIIATCAGNIWYVFHRYTVHQIMDTYAYWRNAHKIRGYRQWLIDHISKSFRLQADRSKLLDLIQLRAAHIIFMSIVCEIIIVFTCFRPEKDSWLGSLGCYRWLIAIGAVIFLFVSVWQYRVLFGVDFRIVGES
jgi:hypothetical protein